MTVTIYPSGLSGTVTAPPSKSYAHRALICAALSDRPCSVEGVSLSRDLTSTLDSIRALGGRYEVSGDIVRISPVDKACASGVFDCADSASTLRFFFPLALTLADCAVFHGSERLFERGISEYERVFPQKGIRVHRRNDGIYAEGKLSGGEYILRGDVSSQFASGLLFALPITDGDSTLTLLPPVESRAYIDMTLDTLRSFGVAIEEPERNRFSIRGGQSYIARDFRVEGDWSNAAFLIALGCLGHSVQVCGLNKASLQGDRMCVGYFEKLRTGKCVIDVSACPDLAPPLMSFAAMNTGAVLTGTRRLKLKESDRAAVMAQELEKFGAEIEVGADSVVINATPLHSPAEPLNGHNDHRVVMALSLPCLRFGGIIEGAEAVGKSWQEFFDILERLNAQIIIS